MDDCFDEFIELYSKGDIDALVRLILSEGCYENLYSKNPRFPLVINYIDAVVFSFFTEAAFTNTVLSAVLQQYISKKDEGVLSRLKLEELLLDVLVSEKTHPDLPQGFNQLLESEINEALLSKNEISCLAAQISPEYRKLFDSQCSLGQAWVAFKKLKSDFAALSKTIPFFTRPFYPRFDVFFPIIILQNSRPKLFIIETFADLINLLQSPEASNVLTDKKHLLYILELYPNSQFDMQKCSSRQDLEFIFLSRKTQVIGATPLLKLALKECLLQTDEELKTDTEVGNWLYHIAKRVLFSIKEERLGMKRSPALVERSINESWRDPHKGMPGKDRNLGAISQDYFGMFLKELEMERLKRRLERKSKIRVVHVVSQIVDSNHAPSRLLECLITHHDHTQFELSVVSTERFLTHVFEYPQSYASSEASNTRGKDRIEQFQKLGVSVHILDECATYEKAAKMTTSFLEEMMADIVIFHGPDVINCMVAAETDAPLRVLFDHGTPPEYPGFDLMIASSIAASEVYGKLCEKLHTEIRVLPFTLDVRKGWLSKPTPLKQLGFPEDCMVMTTISNHLESRLSQKMCLSIAEILQRVPKAYYAPMGDLSDSYKEKLKIFFQAHGVGERVIFLGHLSPAGQYARSMHLYLNEFPFGSGLAMLDVMASGCPVVTMYDPHGASQSRYGGEYMGIDRAVVSGKREDYVDLACQLLTDPEMYRSWREHAKAQYEKHADEKGYVQTFEAILKEYCLSEGL